MGVKLTQQDWDVNSKLFALENIGNCHRPMMDPHADETKNQGLIVSYLDKNYRLTILIVKVLVERGYMKYFQLKNSIFVKVFGKKSLGKTSIPIYE